MCGTGVPTGAEAAFPRSVFTSSAFSLDSLAFLLKMPALMIFKIAIFAAATIAWWLAGQAFIGSIFAVLVAINLLGMLAFKQF